jgi:hypothetical protein
VFATFACLLVGVCVLDLESVNPNLRKVHSSVDSLWKSPSGMAIAMDLACVPLFGLLFMKEAMYLYLLVPWHFYFARMQMCVVHALTAFFYLSSVLNEEYLVCLDTDANGDGLRCFLPARVFHWTASTLGMVYLAHSSASIVETVVSMDSTSTIGGSR